MGGNVHQVKEFDLSAPSFSPGDIIIMYFPGLRRFFNVNCAERTRDVPFKASPDTTHFIVVSPTNEADPNMLTVLSEDGNLWQAPRYNMCICSHSRSKQWKET